MPRVCIAGNDIASQFKDLRRSFEGYGWEVITYVNSRPSSPIIEPDAYSIVGLENLPFAKSKSLPGKIIKKGIFKFHKPLLNRQNGHILKELVHKCDLFIFIWSTFKTDYSDLAYIKSKGKKIAFIFCGDDARWYYGMKQEFESCGLTPMDYGTNYDYSIDGLKDRLTRIRIAEKYADFIFSKREQAQIQLRPFFHFPMCVYPQDYILKVTQRVTNPVVVHAPSDTTIKGTQYVLSAFENLRQKGVAFTPVLIKNKKHTEAKEIYSEADIVIDQLFAPGGGKLSTEALACGKVVLTRMAYDRYDQGFPVDKCPMVDVSKETIESQLRQIIENYPLRQDLANKARSYVMQYVSVQGFVGKIIRLFNGEMGPFDYVPDFFYNKFIPESPAATKEYNKWNVYLMETDWYKNNIKSKTRAGIIF